jgi:undecaprenyl-diphosphatase
MASTTWTRPTRFVAATSRPPASRWSAVGCTLRALAPVALALVVGLVAIGLAVRFGLDDRTGNPDLGWIRWLADRRSAGLDRATGFATLGSDTMTAVPVTILAIVGLRWRTGGWRAPAVVGVAVGGEKLLYLVASLVVGRDRPPVATVGKAYATSSFPSGHTATAITLWGSLVLVAVAWGRLRGSVAAGLAAAAVAMLAVLVAFARMDRGWHYGSDVAAGAVLGAVWLTSVARVLLPGRADEVPLRS